MKRVVLLGLSLFAIVSEGSQILTFCVYPNEYSLISNAYYDPSNLQVPAPRFGPLEKSIKSLQEGKDVCAQYCQNYDSNFTQGHAVNINLSSNIVQLSNLDIIVSRDCSIGTPEFEEGRYLAIKCECY